MEPLIPSDRLAAWCRRWLGAGPVRVLFEDQHLPVVRGLQLADGRQVVVKARPREARIAACTQVQRHLWEAGFPCPELLAGPAPLGALVATAEAYVPAVTLTVAAGRFCPLNRLARLSVNGFLHNPCRTVNRVFPSNYPVNAASVIAEG